jgi:heat shock protein HslJ
MRPIEPLGWSTDHCTRRNSVCEPLAYCDGSGHRQAEIRPVRRWPAGEGYRPGLVANCRAKSEQSAACRISNLTARRRHVLVLIPALFASVVFATVSSAQTMPETSPGDITQGTWMWQRTEYSDGGAIEASDPSKYTITLLPDGHVTIQADCNTGTGSYLLSDAEFTIQPVAIGLMACSPESQDTIFLRDLGQVVTYMFDGEQLVLNLQAGGGTMLFSPMPSRALTGTAWQVTGVNNGQGGVVSVPPDTQLTMMFGDDGNVSGNTGCNLYHGSYTVGEAALAFGPLSSTRKACLSDAAATQERAFLAAVSRTSTYSLGSNRLTLRDATGATQLSLVPPSD